MHNPQFKCKQGMNEALKRIFDEKLFKVEFSQFYFEKSSLQKDITKILRRLLGAVGMKRLEN